MRTTENLTTFAVLKSGSLKLLKPSGPVQACNGIALPLLLPLPLPDKMTTHVQKKAKKT
jgi:hypothetical protein